MMILVQAAPVSLMRDHGNPWNLGVLSSPRRFYTDAHEKGYAWAADNDSFSAWDEPRFVAMLDKATDVPGCLFIVAPDVVGDAAATLERFRDWRVRLMLTGQPIAFVAQDGFNPETVPWDQFDVLFIGGTDAFKMGRGAGLAARSAHSFGKRVHLGRVNSRSRIRWACALGCSTVDGSGFSAFRKTHLPWALGLSSLISSRLPTLDLGNDD